MAAFIVTDFPLPLSPTIARVSPLYKSKLTFFLADIFSSAIPPLKNYSGKLVPLYYLIIIYTS
jgi:hypothetical protein